MPVRAAFSNLLIFTELNGDQIRSDVDDLALDEPVLVVANPHRLIVIQCDHDSTSTGSDLSSKGYSTDRSKHSAASSPLLSLVSVRRPIRRRAYFQEGVFSHFSPHAQQLN